MCQKFSQNACAPCPQKCRGLVAPCTKKFSQNACAPCVKHVVEQLLNVPKSFRGTRAHHVPNKCQGAAAPGVKNFRRTCVLHVSTNVREQLLNVSNVFADFRCQKLLQTIGVKSFRSFTSWIASTGYPGEKNKTLDLLILVLSTGYRISDYRRGGH